MVQEGKHIKVRSRLTKCGLFYCIRQFLCLRKRKRKGRKGKEKETSMLLTCRSKRFPGNREIYHLGPYIRVIG